MSQKTSLCHTVNAPGERKTFGSLKLLPSQAESFTLPVAAWRRKRKQGGRPWRAGGAFFVAAVPPQPRQPTRGVSTRGVPTCMQVGVEGIHGCLRATTDMNRAGACGVDAAQVLVAQAAWTLSSACRDRQRIHAHRGRHDADARGRGTANTAQYCRGQVEQARRRWKHQARVCLVVGQTLSRI